MASTAQQDEHLDDFESAFVGYCMVQYHLTHCQALLALTIHIDERVPEAQAVKQAIEHLEQSA